MRSLERMLAICLLLALCGCNAVFVPHPMGESPAKIETKDWEGTWLHKDGTMKTKVLDAEKGIVQVAWVQDSDSGLAYHSVEAILRVTGEWMFVSFKDKQSETPLYTWSRIRRDGRQILLWGPDIEKFKTLVAEGKLPGRTDDDGNVHLDRLGPEQMSLIMSEDEGVLLNWDNPGVLIRITDGAI